MSDNTFTWEANEKKLYDLGIEFKAAADLFDTYQKDIYGTIEAMAEDWKGEDYNAFANKSEGYKEAMEGIPAILRALATIFGSMSGNAETARTKIEAFLNVSGVAVTSAYKGYTWSYTSSGYRKDGNGNVLPNSTPKVNGSMLVIPEEMTGDPITGSNGSADAQITGPGDQLYDSAISLQATNAQEIIRLQTYREQLAATAGDSEQAAIAIEYIDAQIAARTTLDSQLDAALTHGYTKNDGAIFNITSYEHTGNVSGDETTTRAYEAAQQINETASQTASMGEMENYLIQCGYPPIGG